MNEWERPQVYRKPPHLYFRVAFEVADVIAIDRLVDHHHPDDNLDGANGDGVTDVAEESVHNAC